MRTSHERQGAGRRPAVPGRSVQGMQHRRGQSGRPVAGGSTSDEVGEVTKVTWLDNKRFWQGAFERALKTAAQTWIAQSGVSGFVGVMDIQAFRHNWQVMLMVTVVSAFLSLCTSIAMPSAIIDGASDG